MEIRRKIKRLLVSQTDKAFHYQIAINIPDYIQTTKQDNQAISSTDIQKCTNINETPINTASFLRPSRTGIVYH
jgi:hypothetical protein